jgi:glycosyltransferase involved in cell wall biosynthesis
VIGAVGGLRPVKNYLRFLAACAAAGPGLHVLLVGDGDDRQALEERAAAPDLAGRVHLAGYQADPAPFYRAMDVFVLSSDSEQMPVCLLEAMAACLPAVSTDVGDVRSVLPPEQAPYLVPLDGPDPAAALGRRIAELVHGPGSRALRERLGRENRRRVEESFTFHAMCAAYREAYRSALAA